MHNYPFDSDLVRVAFVTGVVMSMLFYIRMGRTAGGAIVPGYVALFLPLPTHLLSTLIAALLTHILVVRVVQPRLMLWGRRLFEAELLIGLGLQLLALLAVSLIVPYNPQAALLYGVGFVIPGIVAHDMARQGAGKTLATTGLCALAVLGVILLTAALRELLGPIAAPPPQRPLGDAFAYPIALLPAAVAVSVLACVTLFRSGLLRHPSFVDALSGGGFVTGAYLALFAMRPLELLFILGCAALTFLLVTRVLARQVILFGRTRLAAMFLVGALVTWSLELLVTRATGFTPWSGFNAITPAIAALLANDAHVNSPRGALLGSAVSAVLVLGAMWLLALALPL